MRFIIISGRRDVSVTRHNSTAVRFRYGDTSLRPAGKNTARRFMPRLVMNLPPRRSTLSQQNVWRFKIVVSADRMRCSHMNNRSYQAASLLALQYGHTYAVLRYIIV